MSRSLPIECHHGQVVDWGDFGPCQDCDEHPDEDCPNFTACVQCQADAERSDQVKKAVDAVVAAACRWRRLVTIAAPPKYPPPVASTALADAVDALNKLLRGES